MDCGFLWEPELRKFTDWVTNSHIKWYIFWCNLACFKFWRNVWILWFPEKMLCYFFMICNHYLRTEIAVSLFDWNIFEKFQDYLFYSQSFLLHINSSLHCLKFDWLTRASFSQQQYFRNVHLIIRDFPSIFRVSSIFLKMLLSLLLQLLL